MRLSKFLAVVSVVTLLAILYVYQQSKIIQMAYREQESLAFLERIIDKNNNLRYNINCQKSLVSITGLWQEEDFEWPHRKQLVSLSTTQQSQKDNKQIKATESIFTSLFGLKSQAEATSIKPQ